MERIWEGVWCKKNQVVVLICVTILGGFVSPSLGEEKEKVRWGLSFLGGTKAGDDPSFTLVAILPRAGFALHKILELEAEGNFSYYAIKDDKNLYLLGTNLNLLFKPIQWNKGGVYLIGGAGVAYNNSNGKVHEMGDSHVTGVLQGGGGVYLNIKKGLMLRGEYRFHHASDPFNPDDGINAHTLVLGVLF
jgi:hypothetical protein